MKSGEKGSFLNYILKRLFPNMILNEEELTEDVKKLLETKSTLEQELISLNNSLELIEYGIYENDFKFDSSAQYKLELNNIKTKQKELIKNDIACHYPQGFALNGSLKQGEKLMKDNIKQLLRSFNNECDVLINKVKYNNFDTIKNRLKKSFETLNKLNSRINVSITSQYLNLKLEELRLSYEYELKKQDEKEQAKEERERLREEARVQKELEEKRKVINKEKTHYSNALSKLLEQIKKDENNEELLVKKEELEKTLNDIDLSLKDIDYRESNKRAGYVYIISNLGSFGEDVYKIGMTRRLEPLDRVNELGDASVPFNFDVHAMIFSDDAPGLENALHKAFDKNKVNMVNSRREFFRVKLEDIEKEVKKHHDKTVEFTYEKEAEQYRETLAINNKNS